MHQCHVITNPTDAKIRLQIVSIDVNLIAFSSAYVRRSRGEIDPISPRFAINPASIQSELSLRCKGITKNSRYASKIA